MLEAFDYLAKRDSIHATVKKKAIFVLKLFSEELDNAKQVNLFIYSDNKYISLIRVI